MRAITTHGETGAALPRAPRFSAEVARALWGLFFIVGAAVNLFVTLPRPELYRSFAQVNLFGWYRDLLLSVALPNATAITALVVVLEFGVGALILSRGAAVRAGLIGTALWVVFISPAMGWYTIWSPALLVVPLWLSRFHFERDVVSLATGGLRR